MNIEQGTSIIRDLTDFIGVYEIVSQSVRFWQKAFILKINCYF